MVATELKQVTVLIGNGLIRNKETNRVIGVLTAPLSLAVLDQEQEKKTWESSCSCGMRYIIEEGADGADRPDGKRVYPLGMRNEIYNSFECRGCGRDVTESVPGAQYE